VCLYCHSRFRKNSQQRDVWNLRQIRWVGYQRLQLDGAL